jgi:hypothetical protein
VRTTLRESIHGRETDLWRATARGIDDAHKGSSGGSRGTGLTCSGAPVTSFLIYGLRTTGGIIRGAARLRLARWTLRAQGKDAFTCPHVCGK